MIFSKTVSMQSRRTFFQYTSNRKALQNNVQFSSTSIKSKDEGINSHNWHKNINNRVLVRHLGDGIYNVKLDRPNKMNALDMQMFESIGQAAELLRENNATSNSLDAPVRAVILSGEGKAFCTGLDVKGMLNLKNGNPKRHLDRLLTRPSGYQRKHHNNDNAINSKEEIMDSISSPIWGNLAQDVSYLWRDMNVPVIASVHGMCFGGGMQIALGADMRFATPDCRLSIMESKWGLIPDMTASITLRELVRIDVAKELTMTGRIINGREGEKLGLVTRCVEKPFDESFKVAKEIVARSPDSVAASKRLFQDTWVADESICLTTETRLQKKMIASWNQLAASSRNFGLNLPYRNIIDFDES